MGTESSSTAGAPNTISRRRVVAGAAWTVPAVMVASAAPAIAASPGILTFTGQACKLPGNSSDILKGYVFELTANNISGPLPRDAVTVINSVTVNGSSTDFIVSVRPAGSSPSCSCGPCGGETAAHQFCTPDGTLNQQVLIYTTANPTGDSANANMCITYTVYDCNGGSDCGTGTATTQPLCSGVVSTPTAQDSPGGGNCQIQNVFPLPA